MSDIVNIYRYLRPPKHFSHANMGGITFFFEIDQKNCKVKYSFSVCREDENFDKEEGRKLAKEKFDRACLVEVDAYDRSYSLIENVYIDLRLKGITKDPIYIKKKLYHLTDLMQDYFSYHYGKFIIEEEIVEKVITKKDSQ